MPDALKALPHQNEAIDAILTGFGAHDRATAVMACGTGKTLVGQRVAEGSGAREILVVVPSIALMRQTVQEWRDNALWDTWDFACACSDATVADGAEEDADADTGDMPVSTDAGTLAYFFSVATGRPRVLFSTYHSLPVVAEAAALAGRQQAFDLGIMDEAHWTAGAEGGAFTFVLHDRNIRIGKRLFMTATPKHYEARKEAEDGAGDEALPSYSMDDERLFGPVVHRLDFREAIDRDLICDYRVVVTAVTDEELDDLGPVDDLDDAAATARREAALAIALRKAMAEVGAGHVFSFHGRIEDAARFVADDGPFAKEMPHALRRHVNGGMGAAVRTQALADFAAARQAIASSVRCLGEGVNTPSVDMVAFMASKSSKTATAQIIGRALRRSGDKEFGYVFVPVFVNRALGETLEDAVERCDLTHLWEVLNSLREQDATLNGAILGARHKARRGEGGGEMPDQVEFIGFGELRDAIAVEVVKAARVSWDDRLRSLAAYRGRFGHCDVPAAWSEDPELGRWVSAQRTARREKRLSQERIARLDALGFSWTLRAPAAGQTRRPSAVTLTGKYDDAPDARAQTLKRFLQAQRPALWLCPRGDLAAIQAVGRPIDARLPIDVTKMTSLEGQCVVLDNLPEATLKVLGPHLAARKPSAVFLLSGGAAEIALAREWGLEPRHVSAPDVPVPPVRELLAQAPEAGPRPTPALPTAPGGTRAGRRPIMVDPQTLNRVHQVTAQENEVIIAKRELGKFRKKEVVSYTPPSEAGWVPHHVSIVSPAARDALIAVSLWSDGVFSNDVEPDLLMVTAGTQRTAGSAAYKWRLEHLRMLPEGYEIVEAVPPVNAADAAWRVVVRVPARDAAPHRTRDLNTARLLVTRDACRDVLTRLSGPVEGPDGFNNHVLKQAHGAAWRLREIGKEVESPILTAAADTLEATSTKKALRRTLTSDELNESVRGVLVRCTVKIEALLRAAGWTETADAAVDNAVADVERAPEPALASGPAPR